MKSFDTLTEAINDLKKRGYNLDFNIRDTVVECIETGTQLSANEFEITEVHRFEGDTDPGDELVLYAIESKSGLKGTIVNAFGPYANSISDELIAKLGFHKDSAN
ncbi:MAG: phosphoribosylpyrophosphate synthetase [Sphingobacteriales bacterium]